MRARLLSVLLFVSAFGLTSCFQTFKPIVTKPAAAIAAKGADKAIQAQALKLADKIDNGSKPFLHSVATVLRENSGDIVNPADIERIVANAGDPDNQHKFKQLGADLWTLFKNATVQFGKVKGTELIASMLNKAGEDGPLRSTVNDGP